MSDPLADSSPKCLRLCFQSDVDRLQSRNETEIQSLCSMCREHIVVVDYFELCMHDSFQSVSVVKWDLMNQSIWVQRFLFTSKWNVFNNWISLSTFDQFYCQQEIKLWIWTTPEYSMKFEQERKNKWNNSIECSFPTKMFVF